MTLTQALQWAEKNCTPEVTARLRSRAVVAVLVEEIERLRQVARNVYEVWAGSEGIPMPETAPEAYLLRLVEQMRTENGELRRLLARYRDETPLGHQPHMIAHQADEALGRGPNAELCGGPSGQSERAPG